MSFQKTNDIISAVENNNGAKRREFSITEYISSVSKFVLGAIGMMYAFGFIVVNAHLSKFGFIDDDISNPRYLVVGGLSVVFFLCWYLFSGRSVIVMKENFSKQAEHNILKGLGKVWIVILFIESTFINFLFMTAVSSSIFAFAAFRNANITVVTTALCVAALFKYYVGTTGFDSRFPRLTIVVEGISEMAVVLVFVLSMIYDSRIIFVFFSYCFFSLFVNIVIDGFDRYKISADRVLFSIGYSVFFVLSAIVSFGLIAFGNIDQKIGGGEARKVEILLKNEELSVWKKFNEDSVFRGELVHISTKNLFIVRDGQSFVIGSDHVMAMRILVDPVDQKKRTALDLVKLLGIRISF